jgi:hypothetical protein
MDETLSPRRHVLLQSLGAFGALGVGSLSGATGNRSRTAHDQDEASKVYVDDCTDLETTAFGTDAERLTVDTTNTRFFDRPDGTTDGARITRSESGDARLVYKVPGDARLVTVEFHRHEAHECELLIDGRSARRTFKGSVEQYGDTEGSWINERHTMDGVGNRVVLTITGGSAPWAGQIGHVEFPYEPFDEETVPPAPEDVRAAALTESTAQVTGRKSPYGAPYFVVSVDGTRVHEGRGNDGELYEQFFGTLLTGLSAGTHDIDVAAVSRTHTESEVVTKTVELPSQPVSRFVHDCSDLARLSAHTFPTQLTVDRTNPSYFERPDGSSDEARIVRDYSIGRVTFATPKPVASVTAEVHVHEQVRGRVTLSESTDGGDTWQSVPTTSSTYGDTDANWTHLELHSAHLSDGITHVKFEPTGDGANWSPQLGHVEIEYDQ